MSTGRYICANQNTSLLYNTLAKVYLPLALCEGIREKLNQMYSDNRGWSLMLYQGQWIEGEGSLESAHA